MKPRQCIRCRVELDFDERTYCYVCEPRPKFDRSAATEEWYEWNDAIYREEK